VTTQRSTEPGQPPRPAAGSDISVIVATRNRPRQIAACLRALSAQTYPRDRFDVIVVDDGGDLSLAPAMATFRAQLRLQLVEQTNGGPARARNTGAKHATGPLLAFVDDDCEPSPGWLAALQAHFQQCPDRALGGRTVNALPANAYSSASQLVVDYLYEHQAAASVRNGERAPAAAPFFASNNLAVPAALFDAVGGFDESFPLAAGEDREFCDRWQAYGYRLLVAPDAVVQHAHALSFKTFWRQQMNYGRGAYRLRKARSARGAAAMGFEPLSFYGRLVTYPIRAPRHRSALLLAALILVSQVAIVLGYVFEMRRRP